MQFKDVTPIIKAILGERDKIPLLINIERYIPNYQPNLNGNAMRGGIRKALRAIEQAPVVDAVEVVRCRECRLWRRVEKHSGKCPFLIGEHQYTGDDHFCSLAEKREDGEGEMLKDRIKKLLEIMVEYNEKNDNCDECPFYAGWCEGEPGGGCIVEDLTDIVRIAVQKDLLNGGGAESV